jgi:murein DD-endopeptidase MepM/ murein hydrolase activator NlpD
LVLTVSCASGGAGPIDNLSAHNAPKLFVDTWSESVPVGTPLFAVAAGTVVQVSDMFRNAVAPCPALDVTADVQKSVLIEHTLDDGRKLQSWYSHLDRIDVAVGASVTAGQRIGLSEATGCSGRQPRLHVEAAESLPPA